MPQEYYPKSVPMRTYDEIREKRRMKMFDLMGVDPSMKVDNPKSEYNKIIDRLSGMLDHHVSMKMMGMTVTTTSISAGRTTFLWMTISQGEERYVCMVWPKPMFSEGVVHYATSTAFIDRVRMTVMMVGEDQLDFS